MTQEQQDAIHHAELLRQMLQDKRREVEDLEKRWVEANRKARDWKDEPKEFDIESFMKDTEPPPAMT